MCAALPLSRHRVADCGVLELLPRLAKTNAKRPAAMESVSKALLCLAAAPKHHSQLVRQGEAVTVLRLLLAHEPLVGRACATAALLSSSEGITEALSQVSSNTALQTCAWHSVSHIGVVVC
jgi:hypothetical protein